MTPGTPIRLRALGHGQVEQLDAGSRLADVDPDHVPVARVHPEHGPRPPAVGIGQPGLDHDALIEQLADHVGHRGRAQPGRHAQVLPTARLPEVQRPQDSSPVIAPQIPHCAALAVPHTAPTFRIVDHHIAHASPHVPLWL
jgi:hypothetical protein